jgi:hypothetical protein
MLVDNWARADFMSHQLPDTLCVFLHTGLLPIHSAWAQGAPFHVRPQHLIEEA